MINNKINLFDQNFLDGIKKKFSIIFYQHAVVEARNLSRLLEKELSSIEQQENKNKDFSPQYHNIIGQLKWIALPALNRKEVESFFNNYFTTIFIFDPSDFDYIEQLKRFLITLDFVQERDDCKAKIRRNLEINDEKIGDQTIRNILKEFQVFIDQEKGGDSQEKIARYITKISGQKNFINYNHQIKTLINIYEFCKISSTEARGLEEKAIFESSEGELLILRNGGVEKISPEAGKIVKKLEQIDWEGDELKSEELDLAVEKSEQANNKGGNNIFLKSKSKSFEEKYLEESDSDKL